MAHKIITIGRQFGSGGHEVAERLSRELGIPLYDRDLVEMAANRLGLSEITVEEVDESVFNSFLSTYRYNGLTSNGLPLNDSTFEAQSAIIQNLSKKGPCVIVGRCADYILKDFPGCINVFLYGSLEDRTNRIMERYTLTKKEAQTAIRRTDHRRKSYYETYTSQKWGSGESHQLLINVSLFGMEQTIDLIKQLYKRSEE